MTSVFKRQQSGHGSIDRHVEKNNATILGVCLIILSYGNTIVLC